MNLTLDGRVLGVVVMLALFDLVGCGQAGTASSGTGGSGGSDGSGTTGAVDGSGTVSDASAFSSSGGPGASGGVGGSSTSGGSGASGGSGGTENMAGAGGVPQGFGGVSNVEEMCATYPAAWGAYMARCHGGDPEEWQGTIHTPCGSAIQSESQGRLRLNSENAASCLDALAQQDCDGSSLSACSDLFTGTVSAGEACNRLELWGRGDECAPGAFCNAEVLGGCTSTCSTYLQLGEGCTGQFNSTPCAPGTQCDPNEGCIVPVGEAEGCSENWHCQSNYCAIPDGEAQGTCQRPKAEGPCTTASHCAAGFRCVGDTGERSCMPLKPVGVSCTFGWDECTGQCSLDGQCEIAAAEGDPCGTLTDPVTERSWYLACAGGLFCDLEDQTCHQLLQPGDRCRSSGSECAGAGDRVAACDGGECTTCE